MRDDHPRARQAGALQRRTGKQPLDIPRMLIVCEGGKTEPQYFEELKSDQRLPSANVQIHPGRSGTDPLSVVGYAEQLLLFGDQHRKIEAKAFETVYVVIDRDQHENYHAALAKAKSLDGKYRNDIKRAVRFQAVASVPCFALWFLLHFQDVHAPIHRHVALATLRRHLPQYDKGQIGQYAATKEFLQKGIPQQRAKDLATKFDPFDGINPYTDVHTLVDFLLGFRKDRGRP